MPNVAPINDVGGRGNSTSDLAAWGLITPATPGDRDGVWIHNRSQTLYLHVKAVGSSDSAPSGTTASDGDFQVAPMETIWFPISQHIALYGLHAAAGSTGYVVRETV